MMKRILIVASLISSLLWAASSSAGYVSVGPGKVTFIENGWFGEGFAVHLSTGLGGCGAPPTEFGLPASHPAYKELVALLMSAYFTEKQVELVVDQGVCTLGARTSITSIRLR